jgi:ribulose 1,5-bisphosphate carboxylase large subunit-like protein
MRIDIQGGISEAVVFCKKPHEWKHCHKECDWTPVQEQQDHLGSGVVVALGIDWHIDWVAVASTTTTTTTTTLWVIVNNKQRHIRATGEYVIQRTVCSHPSNEKTARMYQRRAYTWKKLSSDTIVRLLVSIAGVDDRSGVGCLTALATLPLL